MQHATGNLGARNKNNWNTKTSRHATNRKRHATAAMPQKACIVQHGADKQTNVAPDNHCSSQQKTGDMARASEPHGRSWSAGRAPLAGGRQAGERRLGPCSPSRLQPRTSSSRWSHQHSAKFGSQLSNVNSISSKRMLCKSVPAVADVGESRRDVGRGLSTRCGHAQPHLEETHDPAPEHGRLRDPSQKVRQHEFVPDRSCTAAARSVLPARCR